jgi:hypothetical protein
VYIEKNEANFSISGMVYVKVVLGKEANRGHL